MLKKIKTFTTLFLFCAMIAAATLTSCNRTAEGSSDDAKLESAEHPEGDSTEHPKGDAEHPADHSEHPKSDTTKVQN